MTFNVADSGPILAAFLVQSLLIAAVALAAAGLVKAKGPVCQVSIYRPGLIAVLAMLIVGPAMRGVLRPWWSIPTPLAATSEDASAGARDSSRNRIAEFIPHLLSKREHAGLKPGVPLRTEVRAPFSDLVTHRTPSITLAEILSLIWLAGAIGMLGAIGAGAIWVRRIPASRTAPHIEQVLRRLAAANGVRCPRLVLSSRARGAFVAGLGRATIFLPVDVESTFDSAQIEAILCHELMHVRERDGVWTLLARLACAVAWPNPLVWALARDAARAEEELCDQLVLQTGITTTVYAACLVKAAESLVASPTERLAASSVLVARSHLSRRVFLMLNRPISTVSAPTYWGRLLVAATTAAGALGACLLASAHGPLRDNTPEATILAVVKAINQKDWRSVFSRVEGAEVDRATAEIEKMYANVPVRSPLVLSILPGSRTSGNHATLEVRVNGDPMYFGRFPDDEVHLVRLDGDWQIVDGHGSQSAFTFLAELGRSPDLIPRGRQARERTQVIEKFKQLALAVCMFMDKHYDKYDLDQATLRAKLAPYLKDSTVWVGPDGKPLDVRFNGELTGKSLTQFEAPAQLVLFSLGPRGNLQFDGDITPMAFADAHVKIVSRHDIGKLLWK